MITIDMFCFKKDNHVKVLFLVSRFSVQNAIQKISVTKNSENNKIIC